MSGRRCQSCGTPPAGWWTTPAARGVSCCSRVQWRCARASADRRGCACRSARASTTVPTSTATTRASRSTRLWGAGACGAPAYRRAEGIHAILADTLKTRDGLRQASTSYDLRERFGMRRRACVRCACYNSAASVGEATSATGACLYTVTANPLRLASDQLTTL